MIAILVGSIVFGVLNYGLDLIFNNYTSPLNNPFFSTSISQLSVSGILYSLLILLPLFLGSIYGPWVGLIVFLVSGYISDSLSRATANWDWYAGTALIGFIAGLALIRTKGNYTTRPPRYTASFICILALIVGFGFFSLASTTWYYFLNNTIPTAVSTLILLPILLTYYNRWVSRSRRL